MISLVNQLLIEIFQYADSQVLKQQRSPFLKFVFAGSCYGETAVAPWSGWHCYRVATDDVRSTALPQSRDKKNVSCKRISDVNEQPVKTCVNSNVPSDKTERWKFTRESMPVSRKN